MNFRFSVTDKGIPADVSGVFTREMREYVDSRTVREVRLVHANRMKESEGLYHAILLYRDGTSKKVPLESFCYPPTRAVVPRMVEQAKVAIARLYPECVASTGEGGEEGVGPEKVDRPGPKAGRGPLEESKAFKVLCQAAKVLARDYGIQEVRVRGLPRSCEVEVLRVLRQKWAVEE